MPGEGGLKEVRRQEDLTELENNTRTMTSSASTSLAAAFILPVIVSYCLVRSYAAPLTTPWYCTVALVTTFSLTFTATLLLPIDLQAVSISAHNATSLNQYERVGRAMYDPSIAVAWNWLFWPTYALAWIIMPNLREMLLSGYLTWQDKLKDSLRSHARMYTITAVAGVVAFVFLLIATKNGNLLHLIMAAGNTYGLLLVVILLGYGLVSVPRGLIARSSPLYELNNRYLLASTIDADLYEAVWDLQDVEDCVDRVLARQQPSSPHLPSVAMFIEEIKFRREEGISDLLLSSDLESRRTRAGSRRSASSPSSSSVSSGDRPLLDDNLELTVDNLAKVNKLLIKSQANVRQAVGRQRTLVDEVEHYQALLEGVTPPVLTSPGSDTTILVRMANKGSNAAAWALFYWNKYARGTSLLILGGVCAFMSVLILWSELTMGFPVNLSPFGQLLKHIGDKSDNQFFVELFSLIPLVYMSYCVYSSLLKVRLFNVKPKRQSDGPALVYASQFLVRMQFPLCYCYTLFLKYDNSEAAAFMTLMKNMDTVPLLGTSFSVYAPLISVALCVATFFNVYGRVLASLGVEHEDSVLHGGDGDLESRINEGKALLRKSNRAATASKNAFDMRGFTEDEDDAKSVESNSAISAFRSSSYERV